MENPRQEADAAALADVRLTLLFHLDWLLMGLAVLLAMVRLGAGEDAGTALLEVAPWFLTPLFLNFPLWFASLRLRLRLRPDAGFGDAVWVIFVLGFMTGFLDVHAGPAANGAWAIVGAMVLVLVAPRPVFLRAGWVLAKLHLLRMPARFLERG